MTNTTSDQQSPRMRAAKGAIGVGCDDGYAMTDLVLQDGTTVKISSSAQSGIHAVHAFSQKEGDVDGVYITEGQTFTVDEQSNAEGTRFDDYPFSPLNRVIVHHALRKAGLGGREVRIATGLPVNRYFNGSLPNLPVIERKVKSLLVPCKTHSGNPCAIITSHVVFAEGVAAWVDHCITDDGKVAHDISRPAAVVDIGGRTTDTVTVLPGWRIDHARTGTEDIGVLDLYDMVAQKCRARSEWSELGPFPLHMLKEAVQTGQLRVFGKLHDIHEIVETSRVEIGDRILREVRRRIGKAADLDTVLFVGGGALVFPALQTKFPNAAVAPDPEFANARGLLKYMTYTI